MTDIDKLAKELTEAGKQALIEATVARGSLFGDGPRLICNKLYPPTIAALERRGLVDRQCHLTPLGLAVRTELERLSHEQ